MANSIEDLKKKKAQLEARIKQAEAREKDRLRKADTRRKVLLGALLSDWMERDDALRLKVHKALDKYLKRKIDREVFNLPVRRDNSEDTLPGNPRG
jgi:t-SNARE complex subunit (syntaxin)